MLEYDIIPSILVPTLKEFEGKIKALEGLVKTVQFDVIDNKFAPNKTLFPQDVGSIETDLKFEVHLMVEDPENYIEACKDLGAVMVLVHVEATKENTGNVIQQIKYAGMDAGIVLNPPTDVKEIEPYLKDVSQVLVMTVNPGFSGQKFIDMSDKIKYLRTNYPDMDIEVDGDIKVETIPYAVKAGANLLSSNSGIFNDKKSPKDSIDDLWEAINKAK